MGQSIQIRRGNKVNLPTFQNGELGLAQDTQDVYVGTPNGNVMVGGASVVSQLADIKTDIYGNQSKKKGIAVTITNSTTTSDFNTWQSKLNGLNCEIELVCMEYISTATSTDFTPVSNIATLVSQAKSALSEHIALLKPHIGTIALGDGFVRSGYSPSDINAFFTNWGSRLQAYAQICKDNNIPVLSISCEQNNQTVNTYLSNWQTIINQCKSIYPELQITVAYTATEFSRDVYQYVGQTTLLDSVDIIGFNYYPSLLRTDLSRYLYTFIDTVNGVATSNNNTGVAMYDKLIWNAKKRFNKIVYITEFGCTKFSDATNPIIYPINTTNGNSDFVDQNTWFNTVMPYFNDNPNVDGYFIWHIDSPFASLDGSKSTISKYL